MKRDADDVKKLITELTRLDVFRVNTALREEEDGDMDVISGDIPLVSLVSKDSAPTDVINDLLRAEERGKLHVITSVKQRLIEKTMLFSQLGENLCHSVQSNQTQCTEDCQSRQKTSAAITQCCHRGSNS